MDSPTEQIPSEGNGAGIDLKITVRDKDGRIVSEQCKEGDIYLYNWACLIATILKFGFTGTTSKHYFAIQRTGVQVSATAQSNNIYGCNSGTYMWWANGGKICLGSSSQAPTIRDFDLASNVTQIPSVAPIISSEGNTLKIVISATASFASETTLTECGILIHLPWSAGQSYPAMITRDTFPAVTVPAGGTMTTQFELWFNAMPPA